MLFDEYVKRRQLPVLGVKFNTSSGPPLKKLKYSVIPDGANFFYLLRNGVMKKVWLSNVPGPPAK
jgi:hypothetical protein